MTHFPQLLLTLVLALGGTLSWAQPEANALIIDTRSPAEYQAGHVEDAVLIPYDGIEAGIVKLTEDRDRPIYLYCGSGRRAEIARERLLHRGYTKVTNLGGVAEAEAFLGRP
ncbi:rhodanese-like domain-containing protein [Seongchinamella sediminis]|uniref:Rhodanese-like domain-containing protein n=1 Tax=Seongchinamella sediminis TaxID=2283635 RepID=A0A3L7DXQ7_9GAMM|nr:rhodanese-like domain-containing protein [Seongchinamella sediminis]RLQ21300.1 rhodanese-like domain-containing protein [Seongchinamella sediminis]